MRSKRKFEEYNLHEANMAAGLIIFVLGSRF